MKWSSKSIRQVALALMGLSLAYLPGCGAGIDGPPALTDHDPQRRLIFQNFSALLPQGGAGNWIWTDSSSTETEMGVVVRVEFQKLFADQVILASISEAPFTAFLDVPEGYSPSERREITLSERQRTILDDLKVSLQEDVEQIPGELVSSRFEVDASPERACQRHYVIHERSTTIEGVATTGRLWARGISCFPPDLRILAELTYVKVVKAPTGKMRGREAGDELIDEAETFFGSLEWGVGALLTATPGLAQESEDECPYPKGREIEDLSAALAAHEQWLEQGDLENPDIPGRANICNAKLGGANLQGAYLQFANLEGTSLEGAKLQGAYLTEANLSGAKLGGANLEGAFLFGAKL